jgi:hypothetical protein
MKKVMFILISLSLMSCSTTKSGTAKTIDIVGAGVIHKPIVVDLEVNPTKISKTVELRNVLSLDNAKNEVVSELLKEKSADLLVEPTFESKTKNGKTELTVYGWTANYKNFRQVEEKDIKLLEISPSLRKAETYQPVVEKKKGKGLGWAIGGAAILVGAIIATSGTN